MASNFATLRLAIIAASAIVAMAGVFAMPATAQNNNSIAAFSSDSKEPINIEADSLEVRDGEKIAIFSGNVKVVQGKVTLQTTKLKVSYKGDARDAGQQQIERLEAQGKVLVTSDDQTTTGDWATFEMASQLITVGGDVVLTQGQNVLRGTKLLVDLKSGKSRLESKRSGNNGRVQGVFMPNASKPPANN